MISCYSDTCPNSWSPCTSDHLPFTLKSCLPLKVQRKSLFLFFWLGNAFWYLQVEMPSIFPFCHNILISSVEFSFRSPFLNLSYFVFLRPNRQHRKHNMFDIQITSYLSVIISHIRLIWSLPQIHNTHFSTHFSVVSPTQLEFTNFELL